MKSEASKLIQEGDTTFIKTGDCHPYYLLKLSRILIKLKGLYQMIAKQEFHHCNEL